MTVEMNTKATQLLEAPKEETNFAALGPLLEEGHSLIGSLLVSHF